MNINVIGAGAMGSLFGSLLSEAGETVTLVDLREDHVDAVSQQGLTIEKDGENRNVRITAVTDPAMAPSSELTIVFVKSTHTAAAAQTAARLAGQNGSVLTLQNGMGNADTLADVLRSPQVIAGTTSHGATFLGPGAIRHAGVGETVIGPWNPEGETGARRVAELFNRSGIVTRVVDDVRRVLWAKLFINVGINAITALTGIKNGQLLDLSQTRQISSAAVCEAMAVAQAQGIEIEGEPVQKVFEVAAATGPNRSSMGQDVDHCRVTEITAINGFIVKHARLAGDTGSGKPDADGIDRDPTGTLPMKKNKGEKPWPKRR